MTIHRFWVYLQSPFDDVWLTISLVLSQVFLPFKTCQASLALKQPVLLLPPTGRAALGVPHAGLVVHHIGVVHHHHVAPHSSCRVQGTHVQT